MTLVAKFNGKTEIISTHVSQYHKVTTDEKIFARQLAGKYVRIKYEVITDEEV